MGFRLLTEPASLKLETSLTAAPKAKGEVVSGSSQSRPH